MLTKIHLFPDRVHPIHHSFLRSGVDPNNADGIEIDYVLWLMVVMTDQRFPPAVLSLYPNSGNHFESNGMPCYLFSNVSLIPYCRGYEAFHICRAPTTGGCLRGTGCPASEEDIVGACSLMRRCLKLNPSARPSSQELLQDPWLKDIVV
jgi:hypothetical protein